MGVAAAIIHECGHLMVMMCFSHRPDSITLSIYGIRISAQHRSCISHLQMIGISAAGPLANILSILMIDAFGGREELKIVHLALAAVNLLPVYPLDGGQIWFHLVQNIDEKPICFKMYTIIDRMTTVGLLGIGILILCHTGYNFTVLAIGIYAIFCKLFAKWN